MRRNKLAILLLTAAVTMSAAVPAGAASTHEKIQNAKENKAYAESNLTDAKSRISVLEGLKGNLEGYLGELNTQYEELTESLVALSAQEKAKQEEFETLKAELKVAKRKEAEQYAAMKLRISYMYENGEKSCLAVLLSSESFSDFLNRAENIMQISSYDRDMLNKLEETRKEVSEKNKKVKKEQAEIEKLKEESAQKRAEVEQLEASTKDEIAGYQSLISHKEGEVSSLLAEVSSQSAVLNGLVAKAEEETAAAARAQEEAEARAAAVQEAEETAEEGIEEVPETSGEEVVPDESKGDEPEDSWEDSSQDTTQDTGSSGGSGTLLGNFKLTAYCNCAICCGVAGNLTASGTVPSAGRTVAMAGVPFGTKLMINGNVYTVEDLGTAYGHVDIFFNSHSDALNFGLQYADVYQMN